MPYRFGRVVVFATVGFFFASCGAASSACAKAVLFALQARPWISVYVDPRIKAELNARGWQVGTGEIRDLSWEQLRQFNAVVLCRLPAEVPQDGGGGRGAVLDAKAPILNRYLRSGGGVLLLHDESYDQVGVSTNRFLNPYGARILNEQITDPLHQYRQTDYLQYWFAWTSDVAADHPVTRGVHTLWYPEGYSPRDDRKTCALEVNGDWTVLARGMPSAYSYRATTGTGLASAARQESIRSAPPLLAARSIDRGRFVLFPSASTFTLQAGHHTIWQDIVLSRGDAVRASDTGRMLFNALDWLAEPTSKDPQWGGYHEPPHKPAGPDPDPPYVPGKQPDVQQHRAFRGIIGAHTALSDGEGSVGDWARAARARGLDFLVFTESFPPLTREKYQTLSAQCAAASDASFLCVPGMDYRDEQGDRYVTFAFPAWPKQEWLTKSGDRIGDTPGIYFGGDWAPLAVVDAGRNPVPPWFLKFYGALAVESYNAPSHFGAVSGKRTTDHALPQYLRLMGDQYNSVPIAFADLHRPADLAGASGFINRARAKSLADVPRAFRHGWYAQPQSAYVSEGPDLNAWWIENGWANYGQTQDAARPWTLHLKITSKSPLRQVTIFDGQRIYRRFDASGETFAQDLVGWHDRQHYFVLIAEDEAGHRLVSPTLRTADSRHAIYMCTDMQNTIESGTQRDRNGHWTTVGMMGNYVTGWDGLKPGILCPESELMPQGLDYVTKGFDGGMSHSFLTKSGLESAIAARRLAFGSGDCTIMDNDFCDMLLPGSKIAPTRLAQTHARLFSFTPRLYGPNLLLLERETLLKQPIEPDEGMKPDLQVLNLNGPVESFARYAYVREDGRTITGQRAGPNQTIADDERIRTGGYVAMYPDFYGSAAVYPLASEIVLPDGTAQRAPLHLHLQAANLLLGYHMPGQKLPKGTRLRQTMLVMRGAFGDAGDSMFNRIRRLYGLDGPPAYQAVAEQGKILQTRYTLDVQANAGGAVISISRADLPADLPVRVSGLESNVSAIRLELLPSGNEPDLSRADWRPVGVLDGTGYLVVDINDRARRIFVGHPVLCDNPALALTLTSWDKNGIVVEAHNPSRATISAHVRLNRALRADPGHARAISLPAGHSEAVRIGW